MRLLLAGCALLIGTSAPAQTRAGRWDSAIERAGAAMRAAMDDGAAPGASVAVAVAVDGEIVWSEAFGEATRATRFGIGSISKTLTMAAALALVDDGRLDLDAPVERYLPDFPHRGRGISVRRIAAHQSGLADRFAAEHYTTTAHFPDLDSAYRHIRNEPLAYVPGTRTEYATGLYTIIGRVLERAAGMSYPELVRRKVLEPASMISTEPHDPRHPPPDRAGFFVSASGGPQKIRPIDPSFKLPGAGYLSTAEDMALFGASLLDTTVISPKARREMFRPVPLSDGTATIYALGLQSLDEDGRRVLIQPGGGLGIAGWLAIYPDQRVVVAILSNLTGSPLGDGARRAVARSFLSP